MNKFNYFFHRKYKQIRNLVRWTPIIWKQFDFDYSYALEAFKFQLSNIADRMESDKAVLMNAPFKATRIRMINRLMTKVYDDDYSMEYFDTMDHIYGKSHMNFNDDGPSHIYERNYNEEELKEMDIVRNRLHKECQEKQKRAHKLLWELVEHNIQGFWD